MNEPETYTILPELRATSNPVASYAELPKGVHFQSEDPGEQVMLLLRRHFVTNSGWIVLSLLAAIIPTILHLVGPQNIPGLQFMASVPKTTAAIAEITWYCFVAGYALHGFLVWYYNVFLITNQRVVDLDFIGLLYYSFSEAALHQIQDVEHRQIGLWQLLFIYGQVTVQTSGEKTNIIFEKVPKPHRVSDVLTDLLPKEMATIIKQHHANTQKP